MKKIAILVLVSVLVASTATAAVVSQLYNAATAAGQSEGFTVSDGKAVTIFCDGLAGVEKATLQYTIDKGTNWVDAYDSDGIIECDASMNTIAIVGPGDYRIDKDTTASAVGISI